MAQHTALIHWQRGAAKFLDQRYSRAHLWTFDGGARVPASSSPHVVPVPMSDASAVDPEEAFVASLASCHMLWFLSLAAKGGFLVENYADNAAGELGKDERGKLAMTLVTLRPRVTFVGERLPSQNQIDALHHAAHEECFLAASVRTTVRCEPVYA